MEFVNVINRAAIRDDISFESPIIAQDFAKQRVMRAARLAQIAIVSAHHGICACFFDTRFKSWQVSVVQVTLVRHRIETMPLRLRPAMHGVMLRGGYDFEILRTVTLQALHELNAHAS